MAAYTHMYKYTYVHCLANQNIVYATEEEPHGPSRLSATTNIQVKVQHSSNMVQIKTAMKRGRTIVEKSHGTYTGKLKLNVNMKQRHGSNDQVVHGSRQGNAARIRMDRSSGRVSLFKCRAKVQNNAAWSWSSASIVKVMHTYSKILVDATA